MRFARLLAALAAPVAVAASPFPDVPAVPDATLAAMRGGLELPNGLELTIGVAIETRVDGALALRTVVGTDGTIKVFSGGNVPAPAPVAGRTGPPTAAPPMVTIDREGAGTVIAPMISVPGTRVAVTRGAGPSAPDGGTPLALKPNGPAVATQFGEVALERTERETVVVLTDPTLQLRHLIGSATGVVVANTANDRSIDTIANVNVELGNASALVGSNLLAIDALAADAAARSPFQ